MSPSTIQQLESELAEIFQQAPAGLTGQTHLALLKKPKDFNAMTHGLSGQNIILTTEEIPHYAQMALDFLRELQPVGTFETSNVQLIFEARWRVHRILSVENDLFVIDRPESAGKIRTRPTGMDRQVNAFREEARNIEIISRYESRLLRNSSRLLDELQDLQKIRAAKTPALAFDEDSHPAIIWYRKLQVRHGALVQAKKDYEMQEAAQRARADLEALAGLAKPPAVNEVRSSTSLDPAFRKNSPPPPQPARPIKPEDSKIPKDNLRRHPQPTKKAA